MKRPGATSLAWAGVALLLALNLALLALRVPFDMFDPDELQHAHIAWLVAGGKVLYRDFWDHHGPLFGLLNGALLYATQLPAGAGLIVWCRAFSALATGGILLLTYRLARLVALSPLGALAAATLLASLVFVQDKGSECRPDTWQNLFWLAGVCLVVGNANRRSRTVTVLAGALFGLALLTNAKAALGPFALLLYYLPGRRLHGLGPASVARELVALAAGAAVVYLGFLAYFLAEGAAREFHVFNTVWNLIAVQNENGKSRGWSYLGFMVKRQLPFVLACGAGLACWIADLRRPAGGLARPGGWIVLILALGTGWGWALNNYPQFFLLFLPLWAIIAAFGLVRTVAVLWERGGAAGPGAAVALLLAGAAGMTYTALGWSLTGEHPILRSQKSLTASLVAGTSRAEPMGVLWDICGGFMFNEPVQYYWVAEPSIGAVVERHTGANPFGAGLVAALERQQVRFVVGRDGETLAGLPTVTQQYLREHYDYGNCLWTRRQATTVRPAG